MSETYTIQVPGQGTAPQVSQLRAELTDAFTSGRAFPLARVFELLPLTAENAAVAQAVSGRGALGVRGGTFVNDEAAVDTVITDNAGRQYGVFLPTAIILRVTVSQNALRLTPEETELLTIVSSLPPELGFSDRFVLRDAEFKVDTVILLFEEDGNAEHRLVIQVNLNESVGSARALRARMSGAAGVSPLALILAEAFGDFACCINHGGGGPTIPAQVCLRMHVKVLDPLTPPIAVQFDAMDQVLNASGIRVERGTTERLVGLGHLLDMDAGACTMGTTSAEQNELFGHRNGVAAGELVVYFVRSLVQAGGVQLAGCASHPADMPGCIVIVNANQWTLAHEVGHVLGLSHFNDNRRLMTGNGTFQIIEPPPDLVTAEVNTMKTSRWVRAC